MKKMILGLALAALSLPASATRFKVICCDNSVNYFYSTSFESVHYTRYMGWGEYYDLLMDIGKDYCPDKCVRSVYQDEIASVGLTEVVSKEKRTNEEKLVAEVELIAARIADNLEHSL